MDQAAAADQTIPRQFGDRREEPGVNRRRHVRAGGDRPKAAVSGIVASFDVASSERDAFRESPHIRAFFRHCREPKYDPLRLPTKFAVKRVER